MILFADNKSMVGEEIDRKLEEDKAKENNGEDSEASEEDESEGSEKSE